MGGDIFVVFLECLVLKCHIIKYYYVVTCLLYIFSCNDGKAFYSIFARIMPFFCIQIFNVCL